MGSRTILCGGLHLSRAAFEAVQDAPLIEMAFMASDAPGEINAILKAVKARELFASRDAAYQPWARNHYDDEAKLWTFGVSLHDDDLPNADTALLGEVLSEHKDEAGTDFVVALAEWSGQLEYAWRIGKGKGVELEPLPKLPPALSSLIAEGKYEEALGKLAALLTRTTGG